MKKFIMIHTFVILMTMTCTSVYAGQTVHLKNDDVLNGTIIEETEDYIVLQSDLLGNLTINKKNITSIDGQEAAIQPPAETPAETPKKSKWTGNLETGYTLTKGNTESSAFNLGASLNRKTDHNETTFKATITNASEDKKMNEQTWYTMGRYAYSFGKDKKWFHPFKLEVDHDKFANVDYRYIPSTGIGYWFSDEDDYKLMSELNLGWEHTEYNDGSGDEDEFIVIPHAYFEYKILGNCTISEDFIAYPSVSNIGEYRFISTAAFTCPLYEALSLKFSWVHEYDSDPVGDAEKLDQKLTTSLVYTF